MKDTTIQTPPAQDVVYLEADDVARRWLSSAAHVRRLIESGRLPAMNIGTSGKRARWRVRLSDLEEYERRASTQSPSS